MKLNRLETHDRYKQFTKQSFDISECCQDLINKRPFGTNPFYIFAHTRTDEDGVTKRLIWQPRLTKPKAQTNSMLFKAYPLQDNLRIIWIIPDRALWNQFVVGNVTENKLVRDSINDFRYNRNELERKDDDDLNDEQIDAIYRSIGGEARNKKQTTPNS